jgi:hypothetical protein
VVMAYRGMGGRWCNKTTRRRPGNVRIQWFGIILRSNRKGQLQRAPEVEIIASK